MGRKKRFLLLLLFGVVWCLWFVGRWLGRLGKQTLCGCSASRPRQRHTIPRAHSSTARPGQRHGRGAAAPSRILPPFGAARAAGRWRPPKRHDTTRHKAYKAAQHDTDSGTKGGRQRQAAFCRHSGRQGRQGGGGHRNGTTRHDTRHTRQHSTTQTAAGHKNDRFLRPFSASNRQDKANQKPPPRDGGFSASPAQPSRPSGYGRGRPRSGGREDGRGREGREVGGNGTPPEFCRGV